MNSLDEELRRNERIIADDPLVEHIRRSDFIEEYGGIWGEHPDYPVHDWQDEVCNDDTRQGYWDWVLHQIEIADEDRPPCLCGRSCSQGCTCHEEVGGC